MKREIHRLFNLLSYLVPSSSSEELSSPFSCNPKNKLCGHAVAISFFLSDVIALSWNLDLLFTELYS